MKKQKRQLNQDTNKLKKKHTVTERETERNNKYNTDKIISRSFALPQTVATS